MGGQGCLNVEVCQAHQAGGAWCARARRRVGAVQASADPHSGAACTRTTNARGGWCGHCTAGVHTGSGQGQACIRLTFMAVVAVVVVVVSGRAKGAGAVLMLSWV